jgi:hypothetical protein
MWVVRFKSQQLNPRGRNRSTHCAGGWEASEPVWTLWWRESHALPEITRPARSLVNVLTELPRLWAVSWEKRILFTPCHPISSRSILASYSPNNDQAFQVVFPFKVFRPKFVCISHCSLAYYMPHPSCPSLFYLQLAPFVIGPKDHVSWQPLTTSWDICCEKQEFL